MTSEDAIQQTINPDERVVSEFDGGRLIVRDDVDDPDHWRFLVELRDESGDVFEYRAAEYDMARLAVGLWIGTGGFPVETIAGWVPFDVAEAGRPALAAYLRVFVLYEVEGVARDLDVAEQTVYQYGTRVRVWAGDVVPEDDPLASDGAGNGGGS